MLYDFFVFCYKLYVCIMIYKFIQCVNGCVDIFVFVYKLNGIRKKINGLG